MNLIIIDNYDSFTLNLYQMLAQVGADEMQVFRNDEIDLKSIKNLNPDRVVLSPGPGHPAIEGDFGICKDIIVQSDLLQCPVLGICLGHQGIVQHLGGKISTAPQIVHGKSSTIKITRASALFNGLPKKFPAMRYHSLIAYDELFPKELSITAREEKDDLIMAVQHKTKPIYGLQFHPESIGTPIGIEILRNFIERC